MPLETFLLPPDQAGYAVEDGQTFIMVQLEGGLSKVRRDIIGAARVIDVTWIFNRSQYRYFTAFYETKLKQGSLPFQMDLILDHPIPATYQCKFFPNKKLSEQKGLSYTVTAKLEALPPAAVASLDNAIVAAFEADPNVNLINYTVGALPRPPEPVGSVPTQLGDEGGSVNFDTSVYFDDPDSVGLEFSAAGLPEGLSINSSTGVITGTIIEEPGIITTTVFAANAGGIAQQEFEWIIVEAVIVYNHLKSTNIVDPAGTVATTTLVNVPA